MCADGVSQTIWAGSAITPSGNAAMDLSTLPMCTTRTLSTSIEGSGLVKLLWDPVDCAALEEALEGDDLSDFTDLSFTYSVSMYNTNTRSMSSAQEEGTLETDSFSSLFRVPLGNTATFTLVMNVYIGQNDDVCSIQAIEMPAATIYMPVEPPAISYINASLSDDVPNRVTLAWDVVSAGSSVVGFDLHTDRLIEGSDGVSSFLEIGISAEYGSTRTVHLDLTAGYAYRFRVKTTNALFGGEFRESESVRLPCSDGSIESDEFGCSLCPPGAYSLTNVTGAFCLPCEGNTFSFGGASECETCEVNTLASDEKSACIPCKACSEGTYIVALCSAVDGIDTSCTKCDGGTYQDLANQGSCKDCPAGSFCPSGSAVPSACPQGTFCPGQSQLPIPVQSGYFQVGASGETVVASAHNETVCPAGSFCDTGTIFVCEEGQYCPVGASSPVACPQGNYCASPSEMVSCDSGEYCPASSLVPQICEAGSYCSLPWEKETCIEGAYCPEGSVIYLIVSIGYYSATAASGFTAEGAVKQERCLPGTYCDQGQIYDCQPGEYCPSGSPFPSPCAIGHYCNGHNQIEW
jgi:hypothetical protein